MELSFKGKNSCRRTGGRSWPQNKGLRQNLWVKNGSVGTVDVRFQGITGQMNDWETVEFRGFFRGPAGGGSLDDPPMAVAGGEENACCNLHLEFSTLKKHENITISRLSAAFTLKTYPRVSLLRKPKQKVNKTQAGAGLPEGPSEGHDRGNRYRPEQAGRQDHAGPRRQHQEQGQCEADRAGRQKKRRRPLHSQVHSTRQAGPSKSPVRLFTLHQIKAVAQTVKTVSAAIPDQ